jgi:hypothetical protein
MPSPSPRFNNNRGIGFNNHGRFPLNNDGRFTKARLEVTFAFMKTFFTVIDIVWMFPFTNNIAMAAPLLAYGRVKRLTCKPA